MRGNLATSQQPGYVARYVWRLLLAFFLLLIIGLAALLGPRVRIGRNITWGGVTLGFPKPVVCCAVLRSPTLFCTLAGTSLWNLASNWEIVIIYCSDESGRQVPGFSEDDLLEVPEPKEGTNVRGTKYFEEGPGSDADKEPRRAWRRVVLERRAEDVVMAVDSIVVHGASFSVTIYAMSCPPWPETELLHLVRSVEKSPTFLPHTAP